MFESVEALDFNDFETTYSSRVPASSDLTADYYATDLAPHKMYAILLMGNPSQIGRKDRENFLREKIKPLEADARGKVEVTISLGSEKTEITVGGKAEIHDNKGNSAGIKVETNGERTDITISGERESKRPNR